MAVAPATEEQLRPRAYPSCAGPAEIAITYHRARIGIARPITGGAVELDSAECTHLHTTRKAAERCAAILARKLLGYGL